MKPLQISGQDRLASGARRVVYLHPHEPDKLIKVFIERRPERRALKLVARRLLPLTRYRFVFREYHCFVRAAILSSGRRVPSPVVSLYGMAETDLGLGTVSERISRAGETIGPTMRALADQGELPGYLEELNDFVARMFGLGIRANDINTLNLVLGERDGKVQFILVDGLGDSHIIPIRTMSNRLNDWSLSRRFDTMARQTGLEWDRKARRYRVP